jgi:hypothetical protein
MDMEIDKLIEAVKPDVEKQLKEIRDRGLSGPGSYALYDGEGKRVVAHLSSGCYASVTQKCALIVCFDVELGYAKMQHKKLLSSSTKEKYLHWLLNDSPYKEVFLIKDAKEVMSGGAYINIHLPSNMMMGGMIAYRMTTEWGDQVRMWETLVDGGVDANLSFVLANSFDETFKFSNYDNSHRAVPQTGGEETYKNFMDDTTIKENINELFSETFSYCRVFKVFSNSDYSSWLRNVSVSYPSATTAVQQDWNGTKKKMATGIKKDKLVDFGFFIQQILGGEDV